MGLILHNFAERGGAQPSKFLRTKESVVVAILPSRMEAYGGELLYLQIFFVVKPAKQFH